MKSFRIARLVAPSVLCVSSLQVAHLDTAKNPNHHADHHHNHHHHDHPHNHNNTDFRVHQPSFSATSLHSKPKSAKKSSPDVTLDTLKIISGSGNKSLAEAVARAVKVPLSNATISRFADGEVSVQITENIRGKDVFIIQSCAAPVNDSIMELLLTVSCARRASARRIVAVIPYFGYKHHRRGNSISSKHSSRFLTSGAADFAMMLQELGVDRVIGVDLQRPGQGLEACFFDNSIPVETVLTSEAFVTRLVKTKKLTEPITVVAPNAEVYKKAKKFQKELQKKYKSQVDLIPFFSIDSGSGPYDAGTLSLVGQSKLELKGDAIIVDDMVDTAGTIQSLSSRLHHAGAKNIYVCASHGLFSENAMEFIDNSHVTKIFVTDSLILPKNASKKIEQISLAPFLADMILTEHFRTISLEEEAFEEED